MADGRWPMADPLVSFGHRSLVIGHREADGRWPVFSYPSAFGHRSSVIERTHTVPVAGVSAMARPSRAFLLCLAVVAILGTGTFAVLLAPVLHLALFGTP